MTIVAFIGVFIFVILILAVAFAPKGHEDENGFHYDDDDSP